MINVGDDGDISKIFFAHLCPLNVDFPIGNTTKINS